MMKRFSQPICLMLCALMAMYWPFSVALMARQVAVNPAPAPGPAQVQILHTPRQVLDDQQAIFEELFGHPYDSTQWTYPLNQQVIGEGAYDGVNHLGQSFTLDVLLAESVDVATVPGLTAQERQFAIDNGFAYVGVIGTLSTDLASIPIQGVAISQSNATIPFDSRLIVCKKINPNHPLFTGQQAMVQEGGEGGPIVVDILLIPIFCPDPECAEDCEDAYDNCVGAAQDEYEDGVADAQEDMDEAQDLYDAAKSSAQNVYDTLMNTAKNALVAKLAAATVSITVAHIKCAAVTVVFWWTGGAATLACVLIAQAIYAGAVASALYSYNTAESNAQMAYDAIMDPAQTAYDNAVAEYEEDLEDLQNELQDDLDDCQSDYDDCIDDCPWVICGWIIIVIYGH